MDKPSALPKISEFLRKSIENPYSFKNSGQWSKEGLPLTINLLPLDNFTKLRMIILKIRSSLYPLYNIHTSNKMAQIQYG